jgi:peroxiredoxin Q/BCP
MAMPNVGEPAPDFRVKTDKGEEVTLAAVHGKTVVLWFYPMDDTPG